LYELASDAELTAYIDDVDALEDALGGVPAMPRNDYICLVDHKTQNTSGGTFTSGAWQTRDLNVELADDGGHCSLSANQFTLSPGTYVIQASAPAFYIHRHQLALYNVSAGTYPIVGSSEYNPQFGSVQVQTRSMLAGQFTIAATSIFELRHRCETTQAAQGFGVEANLGTEVYAIVQLWKR
jgi:hypothetical protein